jgi:uncharacterized membrane protein YeaQ/YmgE (transglycosylase-associated protein family)
VTRTPLETAGQFATVLLVPENNMILGIIGWLIVAMVVGFIASRLVDLHGDDPRLGFGAAVAGALVAAIGYTLISGAGVTAFNVWSLIWAAIGAVVATVVWHAVRSRFVSHDVGTRRSSYSYTGR